MKENTNLQTENITKEAPTELTELFKDKEKPAQLSDIINVQAIICVAISILYISLNMLRPNMAIELYDTFFENFNGGGGYGQVYSEIEDFVNSKPIDYD